ncbi:Receptor expression-enhancing protein 3 [Galdieria sulphuraria]|uniref:HVA22 family protein isoform 1 n=1 Tax=Galdieria sulphuraria TaxID=130081 RepID=M2W1C7_GALSU|nr:HVA22 family protein isoform 2 [Galdieria sulphuraria]XP_005705971.1 HVA22 family protein isoform 1 [Galdieria sulphuraria]EME29450.1 HVA22 family protein isoform 2 [Galdieria sulphuraria]EME29451.1 HVA22 family protein isoform 1 [Galdieria sulphuraria]GJD06036.1 Receptor expression-enhancing protein 3 [Galdieria sulphuraria]|eukprot:XP_005705970.1 HVA22 family protein isoform 2 [Galdieria sulphuraria]
MGSVVSRLGCSFLGILYPAYCTFKTLKRQEFDEQTQWLTFWIVYSCFMVLERVADVLLAWIPLYYECKLLFVCWLVLPQFRGAHLLYKQYVGPCLARRETQIDHTINKVKKGSTERLHRWAAQGLNYVKKSGIESLVSLQEEELENKNPNVGKTQTKLLHQRKITSSKKI